MHSGNQRHVQKNALRNWTGNRNELIVKPLKARQCEKLTEKLLKAKHIIRLTDRNMKIKHTRKLTGKLLNIR